MTLTITAPAHPPSALATANTYAGRTIKQFMRTPQLLVVQALTSTMFLLIFRYVFGGAIQTGDVEYVDFLIPALAAVSGLFASGAVGVAEDAESGLFDRLRSLPVPRWALLFGRSMADTALICGARSSPSSSASSSGSSCAEDCSPALAALGLCVLFAAAFSWLQIYLGLISGSAPGCAGHLVRRLPVDLRVQRLRPGRDRCPVGCSRSPRTSP